jgi:hypothetical protein
MERRLRHCSRSGELISPQSEYQDWLNNLTANQGVKQLKS